MSKSQVLADIKAKIKTNGNQEITGDILQGVLTESVNLVPENVSDLANDVKYQTETEVNAKVKVVSDEVDNVKDTVSTKATKSDLDALSTQVTTNTSDIATLQTEMGSVNNQLTEING